MKTVTPLLCNILSIHPLTDTIIQLSVEPVNQQRLQYQAGQYIKLLIPQQPAMPFSIANAPLGSRQLELHIRHTETNHYSQLLLTTIKHTGHLHITGPFGQCIWSKAQANHPIIFLAGGTGFAPIKAMIEQALSEGCTTPMHLYWVAKTRSDLYLDELPLAWSYHVPHFHYTPILSEPDTAWAGKIGRIYEIVKEDYEDLLNFQVFAAGPYDMIRAAWQALALCGLKKERFRSDVFAPE